MKGVYSSSILFCIIALLTAPGISLAQLSESGFNQTNPSSLIADPAFPEPNEDVTITLNDYSVNTDGATISWFIDGTEQTNAKNSRQMSITAKTLGEQTDIVTRTKLPNGSILIAQKTIRPVRVDMLVEADSRAPNFYQGRSIPTRGGTVQVTALPFTGEDRAPESFSYKWQVEGKVQGGGAQFGKNTLTFEAQFQRQVLVSVDIFDRDGSLVTSESIIIPLAKPELYFYPVNPLRGVADIAMGKNFIFVGDEMKVRAEPFFIDNSLFDSNPLQEWKLNKQTITNPSDDQQEITLRRTGATGSFTLEYHIRNLQQLLQGVKGSITINF